MKQMKRKKSKNIEGKLIDGRLQYSTTQVLGILDLEAERFRQWINGGFINPDVRAGGTGRTHFFLKEHIYIIAIFMKLVDLGLNRSVAKDIAYVFRPQDWSDVIYREEPLYLIIRGRVTPKSAKDWKKHMRYNITQRQDYKLMEFLNEPGLEVALTINLINIANFVDKRINS